MYTRGIKIIDLGLVDFVSGLEKQREIFLEVKNGKLHAALILCSHYPVITFGRNASKKNILVSEDELKKMKISLYHAERGGDVTYHGPGQIMVYPIVNLSRFNKDIHLFLRCIEKTVMDLLSILGVPVLKREGFRGVWVNEDKIASIGIAIKNWITFYGASINIKKDDLANFRIIRPCGMDIRMTSLESVLNRDIRVEEVKGKVIEKFKEFIPLSLREGQGEGG